MKNFRSIIALLLLLSIVLAGFTACGDKGGDQNGPTHIDYVAQTKLDMNSETKKLDVTNNYTPYSSHIDGDTTHFNHVDTSISVSGTLKARYLAVNTPESTGRIEEWGKAASAFTKEKLSNAVSIIVESDSEKWNYDGNGRFLVWVWYQPEVGAEYRCLNIEILQNGLAVGSSPASNRYGEACVAAIAQATREKLYIFSGDKDPEYPYGEAQSVTIKELRTNINEYDGGRVAFEGTIIFNSDWTAYIVEYDAETDMYYGMQLFYGYNSTLTSALAQGNRVRVVGTVGSHYGTWQIASLNYNAMKPKDPANTSVLEKNCEVVFNEITADRFNSNVVVEIGEETQTFSYKELAVSTAISMKGLKVVDTYTTKNGSSAGAMTLTCQVQGEDGKTYTIDVRTEVLKDKGNVVTEDRFIGKTIDVKGIVEYYVPENSTSGTYQIKVYTFEDIVIH